jgi:hypothetical protein
MDRPSEGLAQGQDQLSSVDTKTTEKYGNTLIFSLHEEETVKEMPFALFSISVVDLCGAIRSDPSQVANLRSKSERREVKDAASGVVIIIEEKI